MKKGINEDEATKLFLETTFKIINDYWKSGMADDLQKVLGIKKNLKSDYFSLFHFANAFIALQMNTLFHILPNDQALRMKNYIFKNLQILWHDKSDPYLAETACETVEKIENLINFFPDYPDGFPINTYYEIPPLINLAEAIGICLSDLFNIDLVIKIKEKLTYNLFTTAILGDTLLVFSNTWNWKKFLNKIKLVQ